MIEYFSIRQMLKVILGISLLFIIIYLIGSYFMDADENIKLNFKQKIRPINLACRVKEKYITCEKNIILIDFDNCNINTLHLTKYYSCLAMDIGRGDSLVKNENSLTFTLFKIDGTQKAYSFEEDQSNCSCKNTSHNRLKLFGK